MPRSLRRAGASFRHGGKVMLNYTQPCGCIMQLDEDKSHWFPVWCERHVMRERTLSSVGEQVRILGLAKAAHRLRVGVIYRAPQAAAGYTAFRKDAIKLMPGGFDL